MDKTKNDLLPIRVGRKIMLMQKLLMSMFKDGTFEILGVKIVFKTVSVFVYPCEVRFRGVVFENFSTFSFFVNVGV